MAFKDILILAGSFVGSLAVLLLVRGLVIKFVDRKQSQDLRHIIISVIRTPSYLWCLCISLLFMMNVGTVPEKYTVAVNKFIQIALFVSVIIVTDKMFVALVRRMLQKAQSPMAKSGLIRALIATFVFGVGGLIVLSQIGVQIGPLLTAMGIGGLTAALAFKDTVENMFSGINLLVDKSVEVGDLIKLEGQEGIVDDIGWRTSKIKLSDDMGTLIVPNTKLAQNITLRKKKNAAPTVAGKTPSLVRNIS